MSKKLVIVESPTKAKTLKKILGQEYQIKASVGHIADLPKKTLGIDIERGFNPTYVYLPEKKKYIDAIKAAAQDTVQIFLAPDPDREGEAIAWHLSRIIPEGKRQVQRVLFHEITQKAVLDAFHHPTNIDLNKVAAQQARRILDRLVGYQVSPILWKRIKNGLSAGRVQSVALRLICEREREIVAFKPEEFWVINAIFEGSSPPKFEAKLVKRDNKKIKIGNKKEVDLILDELEKKMFSVSKVTAREQRKNPPPPFITSTLQQEAHKRFHFSAQKTMTLAQKLYEGKNIGDEGTVGLITYMRTDSVRISMEFVETVRKFITSYIGSDYVPQTPNLYKNKNSAQDAHEAIRPTSVVRTPEKMKNFLSQDEHRVYKLIWQQTVESQMKPAVIAQTLVEISGPPYTFLAQGRVQLFDGFQKLHEQNQTHRAENKPGIQNRAKDVILPKLEKDQNVSLCNLKPKQQFTQPPPRYNEASLIKELEKNGIGRPSTYATIVQKIKDHGYTSKEKGNFVPTKLGFTVTDLLINSFPAIFTITFTANMEANLDRVESGEVNWKTIISDFYTPFHNALEKARKVVSEKSLKIVKDDYRIQSSQILTDDNHNKATCPTCGARLVRRKGRHGFFLACPRYPDCTYTLTIQKAETKSSVNTNKQNVTLPCTDKEKTCPQCGSNLVLRNGKHGEFYGCTAFPTCTYTEPLDTNFPCFKPGCSGKLVKRTSKKGLTFFGCSRYPNCQAVLWKKPVMEPCPLCKAQYSVKKTLKMSVKYYCVNEQCGHIWKVNLANEKK